MRSAQELFEIYILFIKTEHVDPITDDDRLYDADLSSVVDPVEAGAAGLVEIVVVRGRADAEPGGQVRVPGGGCRQLVEHVVVSLGLRLVSDPGLLQQVILTSHYYQIFEYLVFQYNCPSLIARMVSFIDCLMKFLMMP